MKIKLYIIFFSVILFSGSCITQFIPEVPEDRTILVVEGIVSDDPLVGTRVKLSRSLPVNTEASGNIMPIPVSSYAVWITDDLDHTYNLYENFAGIYISSLLGTVGRKYTLHFRANQGWDYYTDGLTFHSLPMEMKPVPQIDSIYYEKKEMMSTGVFSRVIDGCQIYIDTKDEANQCRYFRWDYDETWEIFLPFSRAINPTCWITRNSNEINVKSTAGLSQSVVSHFPLKFISNESDRLNVKYSMLVNQFSLTEDEFVYWEKLKSVTQDVGSLYDITPAEIPNNIYCEENPAVKTLGYFSVSSVKRQRVFIRDYFRGLPNLYRDCTHDTIYGGNPAISDLNNSVWILEQNIGPQFNPQFTTVTYTRGCADCTTRGTKTRPSFWE